MSWQPNQPNRLGWITDMSISNDMIEVSAFGDYSRSFIPTRRELRFSGVAMANEYSYNFIKFLMENGIHAPTFEPEWRCLYCGSPQPISRTHCRQCAAPRSFIIG